MARISNPDIKPWLPTLLNAVGMGGLGYWKLGQKRKALWAMAVTLTLTVITCGAGYLFTIVTCIDVWKLSDRLRGGGSIRDDECHFAWLVEVFR